MENQEFPKGVGFAPFLRSFMSNSSISIDELAKASGEGRLRESFGTGTSAVISPIGELKWGDKVMTINEGKIGAISQRLYDQLTGIQWGELEDTMNWTVEVS